LKKLGFFKPLFAVLLLVGMVGQGTWALAGTTGGLSGVVTSDSGAPVSGAQVTVTSPSQHATQTTDASGHFSFVSLAPDTYVVSALKEGYAPATLAGVTVFADQSQTLEVHMTRALKTIATVRSQAQGSLVRAGTTTDVYAVNANTATQLATAGGGNNLDSAYSAIYSQPGVTALPGNFGFGQLFFIHGSSYNQIGYEFDGIPVNRAFDNYNANSLSNLGTQSTEVYTGGGPAGATSPTLGGYVNQVIKTGTYPGYGDINVGIGAPGFYHKLEVEAGGATPNRTFSWYAAIRGSNMIPNQLDEKNGGDLNPDGNNAFGQQGASWNTLLLPAELFLGTGGRGPWSDCNADGSAPAGGSYLSPAVSQFYGVAGNMPACNVYAPLAATNTIALRGNDLTDRENVINLHFAIPHKHDGGRDDLQLLYNNFFYQTQAWDNISTFGGLPFMGAMFSPAGTAADGTGNYNTFIDNVFGLPSNYPILGPAASPQYAGMCDYYNMYALFGVSPPCAATTGPGTSPAPYYDGYQVVNATFGQSALGQPNIVAPYLFPSTNQNRAFQSGFSPDQVSDTDNNGSVIKLQYQKNFGSNAYLRLFGYSFYSDWLQTDPNYGVTPFFVGGATAGDYELNTHTRGASAQFADQINAQHLLTITGSYTTATPLRWNNAQYTFQPNNTPIATLQSANGQCYAAYNNQQGSKLIDPAYYNPSGQQLQAGAPVSCLSPLAGAPIAAVEAGQNGCGTPFQCLTSTPAGATWILSQNLASDANINTVKPRFWDAAIQDEFRPSARWDINAGVRFESYGYELGNYASAEQQFWFNQINSTVCVAPNGLVQASGSDMVGGATRYSGTPSAYPGFLTTAPGQACPTDPVLGQQLYHPGQNGIPLISLGGSGTITKTTLSPRVGFTYTVSPNSVLRFSYGRYTQPTPTAFEQALTYPDGYKMATSLYGSKYYNIGLSSIAHDNPIQYSNNVDASWEQHLKGTDWSFKLSPFYRYTTNQSVSVALPGGLAGSFNSGTQQTKGLELAIQKGDPSRDGWSGQLAYTYTDAKLKYQLIDGANIISTMKSTLDPFLSLEGVNGGSPCYNNGVGEACPATLGPNDIANPYYNSKITQAQIDAQFPLTGFYPTFANYFPYGLQAGDGSTIIPPNVFSGYLSFKHQKLQATLTGNLWEGQSYGAPVEVAGLDPRSCSFNQDAIGVVAGSANADYQTCSSSIAIPNPYTGKFDNVGQYRDPWEFNLGAQIGYDITPKVHASLLLANLYNRCFGGSKEPWTAAYAPNRVICGYYPNSTYLGNTPGAGYFYGSDPHDAVNGTTGYPKVFDQVYAPGSNQISSPFQAYFEVQVKL